MPGTQGRGEGEGTAPIRHLQGGLMRLQGSHGITPSGAELRSLPSPAAGAVGCTGSLPTPVKREPGQLLLPLVIKIHIYLFLCKYISTLKTPPPASRLSTKVSTSLGQMKHLAARCLLLSPAPHPREHPHPRPCRLDLPEQGEAQGLGHLTALSVDLYGRQRKKKKEQTQCLFFHL